MEPGHELLSAASEEGRGWAEGSVRAEKAEPWQGQMGAVLGQILRALLSHRGLGSFKFAGSRLFFKMHLRHLMSIHACDSAPEPVSPRARSQRRDRTPRSHPAEAACGEIPFRSCVNEPVGEETGDSAPSGASVSQQNLC